MAALMAPILPSDAGAEVLTPVVQCSAGVSTLSMWKSFYGSPWTVTAADNTSVIGSITFAVQ